MKQDFQQARVFGLAALTTLSLLLIDCGTLPRRLPNPTTRAVTVSVEPGERVNINTATPAELEKLPGIGQVLARRIVAHREKYGVFRRTEHLMMVRGISDQKFRELQPFISIESAPVTSR